MQSSTAIKAAAWLRDTGPAGITALARDLKLSRTSVENALAVLQRHDLIIEVPGRSALEIKILLKSRPSDPRYNIVTRFTFGMSASDSTFLSVMI